MNRYEKTKAFILEKLTKGLPDKLYYHGIHHVLDVLNAAEMLGEKEKISESDMELLKVAVLFHDSGYIVNSENHEKIGCDLAKENLPRFGYNENEIQSICGMVMATKYPYTPKSLLEEIICDADLDYLGRDDFFEIGNNLYRELRMHGILANEHDWNQLQVNFLSAHRYFTKTAAALRNAKKAQHIDKIKELLKTA